MKALAFTVAGTVDLEEIWDHTEREWGLAQARRYGQELRYACHALPLEQTRGRQDDVRPGYLKCLSGSHVILSRDLGDTLEIRPHPARCAGRGAVFVTGMGPCDGTRLEG